MTSLTPELYELIIKIIDDRVREIKVTREEFDELRKVVKNLANSVNELTLRVNDLVEVQKRTEETLKKLIISLYNLQVEVGRLSDTIGFGLEDIAKVTLPGWLYRHLSIEIDELRREFVKINSEEIEVNLYSEGTLKGEKIIILGEVKSRIYSSEVKDFYDHIYIPIVKRAKAKVIGILFGYLIHPSAKKLAEELGLYTIASYEK